MTYPMSIVQFHLSRIGLTSLASNLCSHRIQSVLLILKAQLRVAPKYLLDSTRYTFSAHIRPLRPLDRRGLQPPVLLVPWARTTMVKSRSFTVIRPSLWNRLPPASRNTFLSSNLSTFLAALKICLFSRS